MARQNEARIGELIGTDVKAGRPPKNPGRDQDLLSEGEPGRPSAEMSVMADISKHDRVDFRKLARAVDRVAHRMRYWELVGQLAAERGADAVTAQAQLVTENGEVYMNGKHVGRSEPVRPGWAAWGLEAAGAPWRPPPPGGAA